MSPPVGFDGAREDRRRHRASAYVGRSRSQVPGVRPASLSAVFATFCVAVRWKLRKELDVARNHESRHALGAELREFGGASGPSLPRGRRRSSGRPLRPRLVSRWRRLRVRPSGLRRFLDLRAGDVLTPPADDVVLAPDQEHVTVLVLDAQAHRCGTTVGQPMMAISAG